MFLNCQEGKSKKYKRQGIDFFSCGLPLAVFFECRQAFKNRSLVFVGPQAALFQSGGHLLSELAGYRHGCLSVRQHFGHPEAGAASPAAERIFQRFEQSSALIENQKKRALPA